MSGFPVRLWRTLQLICYAVMPAARASALAPREGESAGAPRQIRGGLPRPLAGEGELRLFFPDCLALAAPAVLFRLKREGYSRCSVEASEQGLLVRGWR